MSEPQLTSITIMPLFITINHSYTHIYIGLFQNDTQYGIVSCGHKDASRELIPLIDTLLKTYKKTINDGDFIVVNQGPGPFTTLRVILATVNGIQAGTGIPLIGVDGLNSFLHEHTDQTTAITIALLNAFNDEVFYGIAANDMDHITGYQKIDTFLDELQQQYPHQPIHFIGNGVELYRKKIEQLFSSDMRITEPIPMGPSLGAIARAGLMQWERDEHKNIHAPLLPLYLKKHAVER